MALQSEDEISRQSRLSRRAADGQTDGAAAITKKGFNTYVQGVERFLRGDMQTCVTPIYANSLH